jgi:hypothetical protein
LDHGNRPTTFYNFEIGYYGKNWEGIKIKLST